MTDLPVTAPADNPAPAAPSSIKEALMNSAAPAPIAADGGEGGAGDGSAKPANPVKAALQNGPKKELPVWAAGVPEHMVGETPEATLEKLRDGYIGARQALSKGKAASDVPESADGYKFELPEAYAEQYGDGADDPLLKKFAERAHGEGVGQAAAQKLVNGFIEDALESGFYEAPTTMESFYEGLGGEEAGGKIVGDVGAFIQNMAASGKLGDQSTEAGKAAVAELVDAAQDLAAFSPKGLLFLDAIRKAQSEPGMVLPSDGDAGGIETTRAGLQKAMSDPRYNPGSGSFDAAFRSKVDSAFDALDRKG